MPYIETMTHRRWSEIAAEERNLFRPHRGLPASDLFLDTMLNRRKCETCSFDCTKAMGNIYGNRSQTCRPKGKTYRNAQLRELVHFITVEHVLEHEVVCVSKPIVEKRGEDETATEQQPPRASGCEATTSLWGWWLRVTETPLQEKHKASYLAHQILKWFMTLPLRLLQEQPAVVHC
jgi:hypothetical protein